MKIFLIQLVGELQKLFGRKRTYIGFGAFLVVEMLVLGLLQMAGPTRLLRRLIEGSGYVFEEYFAGLTLALMIVLWTFLLIMLYLALVAGDVVSKDVEEGTMRMMLCRPISRGRIVSLKFGACVIYTFILVLFIGLTALGMGVLYKGVGKLFVYAPLEKVFALYPAVEGLERFMLGIGLLGVSLLSITSLGFMLSCFNMKPAAATTVTLSVFFLDSIFRNIPYFETLQNYFITAHMSTWLHVFERYIPWAKMGGDYAYLFAVNATFVLIGLASFHQRDFKS